MTRLAHRLNRRVQVQTRSLSLDEGISYQTVTTVWAGLKPVAAGKPVAGVQENEATTHKISMRHGAVEITTDHFLLLEGSRARRFRVRAVTNRDEADEELIIAAEEISDDQDGES